MSNDALVLHRRMRTCDQGALHCREMELRLAEDGQHVLLSRYVERYSQEQGSWCAIQHHRVPLASMIRWMIDQGERVRG
ncbi:hypothetical protein LOY67_17665 [Pseudomonas sp. B21-056]|jgi:hypothetical protein|uniref:hypothetical protein n=1 Tax=Pseudomonas sp. B21-056 TaxID=2895495 RepID=UPI00222E24D1|nr:hypothetical protein [Pseudomonas sp. B21-056]UZE21874.1 hypothetical protein LOY67_17665 [Pseudomonas sp. B21-056]